MNELLLALQFLTRLPIPFKVHYSEERFNKSMKYYPIIGLIIGFILVLINLIVIKIFSPVLSSLILVIAMIVITGGLHIDGLADTADGIFCGKDRAQMFRIMKDSRTGVFGVISIVLIILVKLICLWEMGPQVRIYSLFMAPLVSRWAVVFAAFKYPYASQNKGLGSVFAGKIKKMTFVIATTVTFAMAIILMGFFYTHIYWYVLPFYIVFIWLISSFIARKLQGLTGDTYGALIELSEASIFFFSTLF